MNTLQKIISNTSTSSSTLVEKTCPLCQKKFIPKGRQKYCNGPHFKPCPVCGKPVPAPYPSDPAKCCSAECRKKIKELSSTESERIHPKSVEPEINKAIETEILHEEKRNEYLLSPDVELSKDPLKPLSKGDKVFLTKECIFDSKLPNLIKGHVYDIEVVKDKYTYEVKLTYDHMYREDMEYYLNISSAISFNTYFK